MAEVYITSQELIKTLKIDSQELIDIEQFFDSIAEDEWELISGKDYRSVNGSGLREYTFSGAYTIARYLETKQTQNFWSRLKEWFTHNKREVRRSFLKKKILDNCSSLIKRNDIYFISKKDVVAIFGTRSDYLTKMAEYTKRTRNPLIPDQDYFTDEGEQRFSMEGISKLSQAFSENLTKKNRKEECEDVGKVVKPQVDDIVKQILNRDQRIQTAMDRVKKRDRKTCQISGIRQDKVNRIRLATHHLYSQSEYPFLADVENNLITLTCEVHDQFHQDYMSGSCKPCTIDDLVAFIHQYYPSNSQVVIWLEQQKRVLGNPQPVDKRKPPHVLYLPASKFQ